MYADRFKDKTILVTGGTSGLGKAITEGFAAEGGRVFFLGRNKKAGTAVEEALRKEGYDATYIVCDISKADEISDAVKITEKKTGHIDVLVNNAGVSSRGSVVSTDLEDWQRTFDVNLQAPFLFMRAAIPAMKESGGGSIINIASVAGKVTIPGGAAYCATKAALIHLSKQVANDFGSDGVRCNVVCPGLFSTNMNEEEIGTLAKEYGVDADTFITEAYSDIPAGKPAKPEKIYGLISYLASDESSYMTGAELVIDGGLTTVDPYMSGINKAKIKFGK